MFAYDTLRRYLANKLGFMGSSPEEAGQIQNVCELLRDLKEIYNKDKAGLTGDAKEAAKAKFITEFLPPKMLTIETLLGDSGFCVGNKLSMADVCLWSFINDYFDDIEGAKASIAACPKCQTASEAVAVAAKDWLASRPITMF
jgi:glutathione S-transferase